MNRPEPNSAITLAALNALAPTEAEKFFLDICGSRRWAAGMAGCIPFWEIRVLRNASRVIWQQLGDDDRREALRARAPVEFSAGAGDAALEMEHYRLKFGFNYLVHPGLPGQPGSPRRPEPADPVDAAEFLGFLRQRIDGEPGAELDYASTIEMAIVDLILRSAVTP